MQAYSLDLRQRVLDAYDQKDATLQQIAARFCVSVSWITKLARRRRLTGSLAPRPHGGGHPPAFHEQDQQALQERLRQQPDSTLAELRQACGKSCSLTAVFRTLRRLKITRKKSPKGLRSGTAPTSASNGAAGLAR
jgi:transposase